MTTPRTLYLARHGETPWNLEGRWQGQTDIGLNDSGRLQAAALAERLDGRRIAHVSSSDLSRARETAEIVARRLGVGGIAVDHALRERSFGVFEGLTRDECAARFPDSWARYMADRRHAPPGAEPQEALVQRMRDAVARAAARANGDAGAAVLVVSHGGAIRALVAAVTGTTPPPMENGAVFRVFLTPDGLRDPEPVE
jgi:probable phosphoglycerate mutase